MSSAPATNVEVHYFRRRTGEWSARIDHRGESWTVTTHERRLSTAMAAVADYVFSEHRPTLDETGVR